LRDRSPSSVETLYRPIRKDLARVERRLRRELRSDQPFVSVLLKHASRFRGKRLRPTLLLISARIFGPARDLHVSLAAVVELIHHATLFHDDVLDAAQLRRRVATVNALWGNETSVLFGDYFFAQAFRLCARLDCAEANVVLADATRQMCLGELAQIGARFDAEVTEDHYMKSIRLKTASLFSAACRLGAAGTHAGRPTVSSLEEYGLQFGTAFQIMDDCLDLAGDEKEAGKSLGTDLAQGKVTLPLILLLRSLKDGKRRETWGLISSPNGGPGKRRKIRDLLRRQGVLESALRRARECGEAARSALGGLPDEDPVRSLRSLLDVTLRRVL